MKKALIFSFLAMFIGVTGFAVQADAKRFGGGSSFGKSFSKQKSFSKSSPKKSLQGTKTGSRAGGMMGILGGLAVGGLLGAMFFGGGFEGINFMDILIFAGIAFILFRLFRGAAKKRQSEYAHAGQGSPMTNRQTSDEQENNDAFMGTTASSAVATPNIDPEQFVGAARDIFARMQAGWDAKNIDDIRSFCTEETAKHVIADLEKLGNQTTKTEIGMLDANIENTWIESNLEWVAVHFKALLQEETFDSDGNIVETSNNEVNETWIFQHNPNSDDPTWYLAGIQQS